VSLRKSHALRCRTRNLGEVSPTPSSCNSPGVGTQMTDRGLSPRTVQGAHWVLNAAFRQALQWQMILEVPSKGLKLPCIRTREMQVFSVEQTKVFLEFALPTMDGTPILRLLSRLGWPLRKIQQTKRIQGFWYIHNLRTGEPVSRGMVGRFGWTNQYVAILPDPK